MVSFRRLRWWPARLTGETRPIVFEHISALLETATQHSVLLIERAIAGLFRLASLIIEKVWATSGIMTAVDLKSPLAPHA